MPPQSDNVKAGLFVLVGIVLTLVIIFTLADFSSLLEGSQEVKVSFHLSDGIQGLKEGAAVTLGDNPIGSVISIEDHVETDVGGEQLVTAQIATMSIPEKYVIHDNAVVELVVPTLGSGTRLNIRHQGSGDLYTAGDVITGGLAPGRMAKNLVQNMGIRDKQREQLRNIIANIEALTFTLREDVPQITGSAKTVLKNLEPASDDAKVMMTDLRVIVAEFNARKQQWIQSLDETLTAMQTFMVTIRDLMDDKDPQLREVVDNVHAISDQLRHKTMVQVTDALEKTNTSIDSFKVSMEQFKGIVIGQRPVLERALANFQLTSDQLKLAAIEVRRSPWRLIYKPGDEEVANDNLYDAARSYALAAGTLDAAAESLRAVAEHGGDEQEIQQMLDHLETLYEKYEVAEQAFWEALKNRPPSK